VLDVVVQTQTGANVPRRANVPRHAVVLTRIAQLQEKSGHPQEAVATYAEALSAADAVNDRFERGKDLTLVLGGLTFPGRTPAPRLIAETAPQALHIARSVDETSRAVALVLIAKALPR
jgi:hypothetical protein